MTSVDTETCLFFRSGFADAVLAGAARFEGGAAHDGLAHGAPHA